MKGRNLTDLVSLRGFFACNAVVKRDTTNVNVNELIFHLKKEYFLHNEEPVPFIENIPNQ